MGSNWFQIGSKWFKLGPKLVQIGSKEVKLGDTVIGSKWVWMSSNRSKIGQRRFKCNSNGSIGSMKKVKNGSKLTSNWTNFGSKWTKLRFNMGQKGSKWQCGKILTNRGEIGNEIYTPKWKLFPSQGRRPRLEKWFPLRGVNFISNWADVCQ